MGLTKAQQALVTRARTGGSGELNVRLDNETCAFLIATIVHDLNLISHFPEIPPAIPYFFSAGSLELLRMEHIDFERIFEKLLTLVDDADTYFYCLAVVHKARLKYERILKAQAFPTIDQVGPRGLLQYGAFSTQALAGFLFWRKWLFDIDNRAAQETGYVFEPIIAYAIGGVPYSAKKSPIKRSDDNAAGRQVDCIRGNKAYEIKLRVTIAASGQGRWGEELSFPKDCRASRFTPVLIVLDPTPNPKLAELRRAFLDEQGEVYIGQAAWDHLESAAGTTMTTFLQRYVHAPIQDLLSVSAGSLPPLCLSVDGNRLSITVGTETLSVQRDQNPLIPPRIEAMPDDVDDQAE